MKRGKKRRVAQSSCKLKGGYRRPLYSAKTHKKDLIPSRKKGEKSPMWTSEEGELFS